jgi:hypothetical protein
MCAVRFPCFLRIVIVLHLCPVVHPSIHPCPSYTLHSSLFFFIPGDPRHAMRGCGIQKSFFPSPLMWAHSCACHGASLVGLQGGTCSGSCMHACIHTYMRILHTLDSCCKYMLKQMDVYVHMSGFFFSPKGILFVSKYISRFSN